MIQGTRDILIGKLADLPDGSVVLVPGEQSGTGDAIAVFNDAGDFYAVDDTCTHGQASLAEGWVEAGVLECPRHNGTFCLRTGVALGLPATRAIRVHSVSIVDGAVWLRPGQPPV
jgi:3-phenylpropionate/trans-cinnamate dioxygenase ferredoxin subunit